MARSLVRLYLRQNMFAIEIDYKSFWVARFHQVTTTGKCSPSRTCLVRTAESRREVNNSPAILRALRRSRVDKTNSWAENLFFYFLVFSSTLSSSTSALRRRCCRVIVMFLASSQLSANVTTCQAAEVFRLRGETDASEKGVNYVGVPSHLHSLPRLVGVFTISSRQTSLELLNLHLLCF